MNHLQNQWGPVIYGRYNHASRSRDEYKTFLSDHPPSTLPIHLDDNLANAAYDARSQALSPEDHDRTFVNSTRNIPSIHFSTLHWEQEQHDGDEYPLLFHGHDFVKWKESIDQVAQLHRIHPTLDSSYSPTDTATNPATITDMRNHMYNVFFHSVNDNMGFNIVLNHSNTKDPHLTAKPGHREFPR